MSLAWCRDGHGQEPSPRKAQGKARSSGGTAPSQRSPATDIFRTRVSSHTIFSGFRLLPVVLMLACSLDTCPVRFGEAGSTGACTPLGRGCVCWRVRAWCYRASWVCSGLDGISWYQDGFWKCKKMVVPPLLLCSQKVSSFYGLRTMKQEC